MYDPKEELQAILDLLGEWRNKNGFGYVSMCIMPDGTGCAYDIGIMRTKEPVILP